MVVPVLLYSTRSHRWKVSRVADRGASQASACFSLRANLTVLVTTIELHRRLTHRANVCTVLVDDTSSDLPDAVALIEPDVVHARPTHFVEHGKNCIVLGTFDDVLEHLAWFGGDPARELRCIDKASSVLYDVLRQLSLASRDTDDVVVGSTDSSTMKLCCVVERGNDPSACVDEYFLELLVVEELVESAVELND